MPFIKKKKQAVLAALAPFATLAAQVSVSAETQEPTLNQEMLQEIGVTSNDTAMETTTVETPEVVAPEIEAVDAEATTEDVEASDSIEATAEDVEATDAEVTTEDVEATDAKATTEDVVAPSEGVSLRAFAAPVEAQAPETTEADAKDYTVELVDSDVEEATPVESTVEAPAQNNDTAMDLNKKVKGMTAQQFLDAKGYEAPHGEVKAWRATTGEFIKTEKINDILESAGYDRVADEIKKVTQNQDKKSDTKDAPKADEKKDNGQVTVKDFLEENGYKAPHDDITSWEDPDGDMVDNSTVNDFLEEKGYERALPEDEDVNKDMDNTDDGSQLDDSTPTSSEPTETLPQTGEADDSAITAAGVALAAASGLGFIARLRRRREN